MIVLKIAGDVNTYMQVIFRTTITMYCDGCNTLLVYHACYWVNYKSSQLRIKILILRYKCKTCNKTHSLKPEFLASRHQYDTYERQDFVLQYNDVSKMKYSLRKLQIKLFPEVQVNHTVMYYWVRILKKKSAALKPIVVKELQSEMPMVDVTSECLEEAESIPKGARNKEYTIAMIILFNWIKIYIRNLLKYQESEMVEFMSLPYIYGNRVLDLLRAHAFL